MEKIKVACIFGGCSSEYDVSLVSATSVIKNINLEKYEIIMIGITKSGDFYLYNGPVDDIENDHWFSPEHSKKITFSTNRSDHGFIILETNKIVNIDIAFPILHGRNGEDGRIQGLFELAGIPYVGCDMISSAICMDKFIAHNLVEDSGILVPKSYLFDQTAEKTYIEKTIQNLTYPVYVKPLRAGSSFGITKVNQKEELEKAVELAFSYDNKIVIEEGIDGFEVGCAIMGNEDLVIGEVDEIKLQDGFFDYEEKYTLKTSQIILPAELDDKTREEIKKVALKIYKILGCSGFARVDMFYSKDHKIVFNEVNTIPGCTSHSRYPSMLKEVGYDFNVVLDRLIGLGLNKKKHIFYKKDIYNGSLILVNKEHLLKELKEDLESFTKHYPDILIDKKANHYLQLALKEIEAGDLIVPVSGYRTLEEQQKIFDDSLKENGEEFTYQYIALPNASEHQTGLAIDLALNQGEIDFIRPHFPYEGICQKFREIASKYGFIERYTEEKKEITAISAEEWHFRYVGYPHSEIIKQNDFCLEEYIKFLKKDKLKFQNYEISYIPFHGDKMEIELGFEDSISGNNVDGFIITRKLS